MSWARVFMASIALTVWLGTLVGPAAAGDVFTIDRWPVDATGESAAGARDVALARGRMQALQQVFRRLSAQDYWQVLPSVGAEQASEMVTGLQVANERTSTTRYLAEVSYSFDPDAVRSALKGANVPFSESQARAAVVVPVFDSGGGYLLWEEENPWLVAWKKRSYINELVPLVAPLGELDDIVSLNAADAVAEVRTKLLPFAARYGLGDALVAKATLSGEGIDQALAVRLVRVATMGSESAIVEFDLRNSEGWDLDVFLERSVSQALVRLEADWKAQTIIRPDEATNRLEASVRFADHHEWIVIRDRLRAMPTITGLEVLGVSTTGAEVVLTYAGSLPQLRLNMSQRDLNFLDGGSYGLIALLTPLDEEAPLEGDSEEEAPDDFSFESPPDLEPF